MKKKIISVFAMVMALGIGVQAANLGTRKTIDVSDGVSVYVDGTEVEMKNVNGESVDAFVYDGTTYLLARAISEANGNSVEWNGDVGRVDITTNNTNENNPNLANVAAEEDKYYIFELSDNVERTHLT